jgi:ubiquitin C-terminal hydrolase
MNDIFEGQLLNTTTCLSCGHQAKAFDNFMDLSVEIPRSAARFTGTVKIQDCLDKFIETQRMVDCGYKCEGCKKPVDVEKNLTIYRFPKVLCIHLKRFYHSAMRKEKLNTTLQFPQQALDMRKYGVFS